jgi:hypothetical protein
MFNYCLNELRFQRVKVVHNATKFSVCSSPCSRKLAVGPYPEPAQSNFNLHFYQEQITIPESMCSLLFNFALCKLQMLLTATRCLSGPFIKDTEMYRNV